MIYLLIIPAIPLCFVAWLVLTELFTPNSGKRAEILGFNCGMRDVDVKGGEAVRLKEEGFNFLSLNAWEPAKYFIGLGFKLASWIYPNNFIEDYEWLYYDEVLNAVTELSPETMIASSMGEIKKDINRRNVTYKEIILGAQTRLWEKYQELFPDFKKVQTSYINMTPYFYGEPEEENDTEEVKKKKDEERQPFVYVYGNFCYWHWFQSLRYKHIKREAEKHGINNFILYTGDTAWHERWLNNFLRRRFIKVFKGE